MVSPAPVLPDDPRTGDVGHLLLLDRDAGTYWRVHADGTRTRVGTPRDAERLVRGWMSWSDSQDVPGVGWVPGEFTGERYTLRVVSARRDLERWPDITPERTFP